MIFQLPTANDKEYIKAEKEFIEYRDALDEKYVGVANKNLGTPEELKKYQELQNKYLDLRKEREGKLFEGGHYKSDKNVFAHARFNTRIIDGKKTLYIEELQSDWVHKGKTEGFRGDEGQTDLQIKHQELIEKMSEERFDKIYNEKDLKEYEELQREFKKISNLLDIENRDNLNKAPDLPFKKNWQDVVIKKLIKYASENDFDSIAMAGGDIDKDIN